MKKGLPKKSLKADAVSNCGSDAAHFEKEIHATRESGEASEGCLRDITTGGTVHEPE
jgi:hypothetical protein